MSFRILTRVSWAPNVLTIDLIDLYKIFGAYPLVSKKFFKDLINNIERKSNYWAEAGFQEIISNGKRYEPHEWIFLWAIDFRDRLFWILFSRSYELSGKGAIAAVGPPEFAEFIKQTGKAAIVPTLTLINDPEKMKKVVVIVSNPKEAKKPKLSPELLQFKAWVDQLKMQKNVKGQWFPSFAPVCPVCNEKMVGLADYEVGFAQMICPRCGYQQKKRI
ncbi:MAG: hypothetical protein ACTSRZ_16730 [Promethearchaeota archaeon]